MLLKQIITIKKYNVQKIIQAGQIFSRTCLGTEKFVVKQRQPEEDLRSPLQNNRPLAPLKTP